MTRCAVVAGCLPLDGAAARAELNRLDRTLTGLAHRAPLAVRGWFALTGVLARRAPGAVVRGAIRDLPPDEREAVRAQGPWLATILGEGARQPWGGVDEYRVISAPWGFRPEEVTVPVHLFQGDADRLVPPAWAAELARRIPGAELEPYPDGGHFIALTRRREILGYLAGLR